MMRSRATITYPSSGSPGLMTIYGVDEGGDNADSAEFLVQRLQLAILAWQDLFADGVTFTFDQFVDALNPATGSLTDSYAVTALPVTGGGGAGFAPLASAICVGWRTAAFIAGRRLRGRTFLSPLASSVQQADGTPSSAALGLANAGADAFTSDTHTALHTVVWHRPVGGAGGSTSEITSHRVNDTFAVLRSRRD